MTGPMLVQHDIKPIMTGVQCSCALLFRSHLPFSWRRDMDCSLSAVLRTQRRGMVFLPLRLVVSNLIRISILGLRSYDCPDSNVLSFRDLRLLVLGLESGDIPIFKCDILELTATCFGRCPLRKTHTGMTDLDTNRLAGDDLFDDWGVRLIAVLKPVYVLYEMAPPHSGSYKPHSYATPHRSCSKWIALSPSSNGFRVTLCLFAKTISSAKIY